MSPKTDSERLHELEGQVIAMKALSEERTAREKRMEQKLDQLLAAENRRQGREAAASVAAEVRVDERKERNEWLRHIMPVGVISGIWAAAIWLFDNINGN